MLPESTPLLQTAPFLPELPILRVRLTLRLLRDAVLPVHKGGMLRGAFGYAFQQVTCPRRCWNNVATCPINPPCAYQWVFETPHPPDIAALHDLRDVPRPFVFEPPLDGRARYFAGETLEFGLLLFGRGINYLPYFIFSFEHLGKLGIGAQRTPVRLERVEALTGWEPTGTVVYQDGQIVHTTTDLPLIREHAIVDRAIHLPEDLQVDLRTPLRVKTRDVWMQQLDLPTLLRAITWRFNALATFHGGATEVLNPDPISEQAQAIVIEHAQTRWFDWERTSTRDVRPRKMTLGGIVGSAVLRHVPLGVRVVLVAGSLVHAGKACVFGHGGFGIKALNT